jgi:hypothetical protein
MAIEKSIPVKDWIFGSITSSIKTLFCFSFLIVLIIFNVKGPEYEQTSLEDILPPVQV